MKPRDVVVCAFPGAELTKARPAVVLSTEGYHRNRPDVIPGLITTQPPNPQAPTDCSLIHWRNAGLHAPSYLRLFLVTLSQRNVRPIGRLSDADWNSVQVCFHCGFGSPPQTLP